MAHSVSKPSHLKCVITSPEGLVFQGDASCVVVPGIDGELGFLPKHAPLVGLLGNGEMRIDAIEASAATQKLRFFVEGGFVQVIENRVTVLATAVRLLRASERPDAESRLQVLLAAPPKRGSTMEERDSYRERVRTARRRLHLIR